MLDLATTNKESELLKEVDGLKNHLCKIETLYLTSKLQWVEE